jgi:hypothetical protein
MKNWFKYLLVSIANFFNISVNKLFFDQSTNLVSNKLRQLRSLSMTIALSLIITSLIGITTTSAAIAAPMFKLSTPVGSIAPISNMSIAVLSTTKVTINDNPTVPDQVQQRLGKILNTMQKMRFCSRESCFYRALESRIETTQNPQEPYTATIHAEIDRPASYFDYADYHFAYVGDRWQLLGAEEYTDVADYVFKGDRYEIFSVHASRILKGNIKDARDKNNSLKSGYVPLYYEVLSHGVERS